LLTRHAVSALRKTGISFIADNKHVAAFQKDSVPSHRAKNAT